MEVGSIIVLGLGGVLAVTVIFYFYMQKETD